MSWRTLVKYLCCWIGTSAHVLIGVWGLSGHPGQLLSSERPFITWSWLWLSHKCCWIIACPCIEKQLLGSFRRNTVEFLFVCYEMNGGLRLLLMLLLLLMVLLRVEGSCTELVLLLMIWHGACELESWRKWVLSADLRCLYEAKSSRLVVRRQRIRSIRRLQGTSPRLSLHCIIYAAEICLSESTIDVLLVQNDGIVVCTIPILHAVHRADWLARNKCRTTTACWVRCIRSDSRMRKVLTQIRRS